MQSFQEKRHSYFHGLAVLKSLVLLMGRLEACIANIASDTDTHRPRTVTLAAQAHQGLITFAV